MLKFLMNLYNPAKALKQKQKTKLHFAPLNYCGLYSPLNFTARNLPVNLGFPSNLTKTCGFPVGKISSTNKSPEFKSQLHQKETNLCFGRATIIEYAKSTKENCRYLDKFDS